FVVNGQGALPFSIELKIRVRSRRVIADAQLTSASGDSEKLALEGAFYRDRFLRMTYSNDAKTQLGVLFLELDDNNEDLKGSYSGYSPRRSTIVAGTIKVDKVKAE